LATEIQVSASVTKMKLLNGQHVVQNQQLYVYTAKEIGVLVCLEVHSVAEVASATQLSNNFE
jgi:hypothetical protein